jgi:ATP synthase protein I
MTQDKDPDRLAALEKRIEKLKGKDPVRRAETGVVFSQGEVAWRMVVELVTGMVLGLAIGFGLDVLFGTRPIFLIIFVLLGFGAGIRVMLGTARQMAKDAEQPANDERD